MADIEQRPGSVPAGATATGTATGEESRGRFARDGHTPRARGEEDDLIRQKEEAASGESSGARNLFDLRTIIGALFVLYGLLLTVMGLFDSKAEVAKAAGVRINLWTGLGMLALGLAFLTWVKLRPLRTEDIAAATADDGDEEPAGAGTRARAGAGH